MEEPNNNKENEPQLFIGSEVTIDYDGFYTPNQPTIELPKPQSIKEFKYARKMAKIPIYKQPKEEPPKLWARKMWKLPEVSYYDREEAIAGSVKLPQVGAYKPGDVVWAKSGGWSYWPAMVTVDPVVKLGVEMEYVHTNRQNKPHHYHLQFIGPSMYTAWTPPYIIKPYAGWKAYHAEFLLELEETKLLDDKITKVKAERIFQEEHLVYWRQSIAEADVAVGLDNERRLQLLSYEYVDLPVEWKGLPVKSYRKILVQQQKYKKYINIKNI